MLTVIIIILMALESELYSFSSQYLSILYNKHYKYHSCIYRIPLHKDRNTWHKHTWYDFLTSWHEGGVPKYLSNNLLQHSHLDINTMHLQVTHSLKDITLA